jgi:hypothetical protein
MATRKSISRWLLSRRLWLLAPVVVLVVIGLLASPLAFSTAVTPPVAPERPVSIFIIDYGMTSALALPHEDGLVLYAYGDWQYYALRNNHLLRGIAALTWPTQGALGRGHLPGPRSADHLLRALHDRGVEQVHELQTGAAAVERLRRQMDAAYEAQRGSEVRNAAYGMSFVHHPRRYSWFWNSNHQTAAWLEELGCVVDGPAFASRWQVEGG